MINEFRSLIIHKLISMLDYVCESFFLLTACLMPNSLICLIIFFLGCQRCKGDGKAFEWKRAVYVGKSCSLYCFLYLPSQISSQIVARNKMYGIVVYIRLRLHILVSYEEERLQRVIMICIINTSVKLM